MSDFEFNAELTGDWARVTNMVAHLSEELNKARELSLKRWGLKAERIAKKHISSQDLNWKELSPRYLAAKVRAGYSDNILVMTSTYFQSITSYVENDTVYAGIRKEAKEKDGTILADIAATLEYGSEARNIPARPLWHPTFEEVIEWHFKENMPEKYFLQAIRRYL